jgi:hypothetical protein
MYCALPSTASSSGISLTVFTARGFLSSPKFFVR